MSKGNSGNGTVECTIEEQDVFEVEITNTVLVNVRANDKADAIRLAKTYLKDKGVKLVNFYYLPTDDRICSDWNLESDTTAEKVIDD